MINQGCHEKAFLKRIYMNISLFYEFTSLVLKAINETNINIDRDQNFWPQSGRWIVPRLAFFLNFFFDILERLRIIYYYLLFWYYFDEKCNFSEKSANWIRLKRIFAFLALKKSFFLQHFLTIFSRFINRLRRRKS